MGKISFAICIILIIVILVNIKRHTDLKNKNIEQQNDDVNKKLKRIKNWSIILGILFIIFAGIAGFALYAYI